MPLHYLNQRSVKTYSNSKSLSRGKEEKESKVPIREKFQFPTIPANLDCRICLAISLGVIGESDSDSGGTVNMNGNTDVNATDDGAGGSSEITGAVDGKKPELSVINGGTATDDNGNTG